MLLSPEAKHLPRKTPGTRREGEKIGWGPRKRQAERGRREGGYGEGQLESGWNVDVGEHPSFLPWMHGGARWVVSLLMPVTTWNA